jgi:MFS family permease
MVYLTVFLLSLASLSLEVFLARFFSVNQWNHLSFMVISIALFGFAAGGTYLNLLNGVRKKWEQRLTSFTAMCAAVLLYSAGTLLSFIVVNRLPLDYFRLPVEPVQFLYLMIAYLMLTFPFFCAGLISSAAYAGMAGKAGYLYAVSMIGSALGALLPAILLEHLDEGTLITWNAATPVGIFLIYVFMSADRRAQITELTQIGRNAFLAASATILIVCIYLNTPFGAPFIHVRPSPYKALSQAQMMPDTHVIDTRFSIRGRSDTLETPYIRHAPGLSLRYTGQLPRQKTVFKDGDRPFALYEHHSREEITFATYLLPFAGYAIIPEANSVLIIQNGGGLGIVCALAAEVRGLEVVEQHPDLAEIVREHYRVTVVNQNFRKYLAESNKKYDIIHVENMGHSLPGTAALSQEYFFTVESLRAYWNHLTENGVIVISRRLLLPPADSLRQWAAAFESLKADGVAEPEKHIAILRNWDTYTLLISRGGAGWTDRLDRFARDRNFDIIYSPNLRLIHPNRYAVFDAPYHFSETGRLRQAYLAAKEDIYFRGYPLDVKPQTDARPFPARMVKWDRLKEIYKSTGSRFYSMLMSGEIVVGVVLFEAVLISTILLVLPVILSQRRFMRPTVPQIGYFLFVGAGFMLTEMYFIKHFVLLFDDPIISMTVVLSGVLVFSGIGGLVSQRLTLHRFYPALICLIATIAALTITLPDFIQRILPLPLFLHVIISYLLIAPAGVLAGLPFPLGMRLFLNTPADRSYAWIANGCTSVVASIAAVQMALCFGISSIAWGAVLSYIFVLIFALRMR